MNPEISATRRFIDRLSRWSSLDAPADFVQPLWRKLIASDGLLGPAVSDALHGSWLGHSLHPVVTDVPIGAWTVTAVCDVLELAGVEAAGPAADLAIVIGSAGAAAAALTGWAEWADTKDEPKRLGIAHAGLNGAALVCYMASLAFRARGQRGFGSLLAFGGFGMVGAAAFIGGELSTGMHLGIRHTHVSSEPPESFIDVCADGELAEGGMKRVAADGIPILLSRTDGVVAAVAGACTHRGAPLDEGERDAKCITCPWHGARFDLRNGAVLQGPATFPLAVFQARSRDGRIEVNLNPAF